MKKHLLTSAFVVVTASVVGACTNQVGALPGAASGLPTAVLHCPEHVARGASFDVDGSDSVDVDGAWAETSITMSSFDGSVFGEASGLDASFVVEQDAVVTVALHVKDEDGNVAFAACRVVVDGEGAAEGEGEGAAEGEGEADDEFDLSGNFALVAWDAAEVSTFGLNPSTQCAPAKSVSFVTLRQTGNHVSVEAKTCSLSLVAVDSFIGRQASSFADAAVQAMPPLRSEFDLVGGGAGDPFVGVTDPVSMVIGADVAEGEPLPHDSSLGNVVDSDHDGVPGVSMHTVDDDGQTVDDHAVVYRRTIAAFRGVIVSDDEIDGGAVGSWQVEGETSLLDDWANLLTPEMHGRPSTFKMTRTTATGCADLEAAPPAPAPIDLGDCYVAQ